MEKGSLSFDKRKHPRIGVQVPIKYKLITESEEALVLLEKRKATRAGNSKDLSAEGLFLISDQPLSQGDILKVEMSLPEEHHPVRAFAEVIWAAEQDRASGKYGSGVNFMAVRDEDVERIQHFVDSALASEAI